MARFFPAKIPSLVKFIYPLRTWNVSLENRALPNTVYFTFDDGPIPEVTPWVLNTLNTYNAKASFFCIGENLQKHPEIAKRIIEDGHSIGNHTQHHLNAWKTNNDRYIGDVEEAASHIRRFFTEKKLFRPPYGKLNHKIAKSLIAMGYQLVMWDILSKDYDIHVSKEACLSNVINHLTPGCIVVFHDSLKANENLTYVLPRAIEYAYNKGFVLDKLT